jgi:hypothetical protein
VPGSQEDVEAFGDIPQARFGHTITLVSKTKVVLFGGATGDTGKFSMTGETYIFNIIEKNWIKLNGKTAVNNLVVVKGVPPSPRAAHSCTNVEQMQMVVYGGATGGKFLLFLILTRWGSGLR